MSDILRIVTLSRGGRPVPVLDLEDQTFDVVRGSFKHTPAPRTQQIATSSRRYGGGRVVGETHGNGAVEWTAMIGTPFLPAEATQAQRADALSATVEGLLVELESAARGRLLEWRPDGMSQARSSFFEIAGPAEWECQADWAAFTLGGFQRVTLKVPVAPLVRWAPMRVEDPLSAAVLAEDWTVSQGAVSFSSGFLIGSSTLAVGRHTGRGYEYGDVEVTATVQVPVNSTGRWLIDARRLPDGSVIRAVLTPTSIIIRRSDAGVDGAQAGTSHSFAAGSTVTVRVRCSGDESTSCVAEVSSGSTTVAASTTFSYPGKTAADLAGDVGFSAFDVSGQRLTAFSVRPFVRRGLVLPDVFQLPGVPGTAPALAAVEVMTSGGSARPVWAMLSWSRARSGLATEFPHGVVEAESATTTTGWAVQSDAGSRGGSRLVDTAVSGAETYRAQWWMRPWRAAPDDFTDGEIALEVWAVAVVSSTLVSPTLTVSLVPGDGTAYGTARSTAEWGRDGRLVTVPTSGTVRRPVRLGTLLADADQLEQSLCLLRIDGSTGAGSSGVFGLDYLWLAPARSRALGPTGKPSDETFPAWVPSTTATTKRIRSDLSGQVIHPASGRAYSDHGLGGAALWLPTGDVELAVKLSSLVPDDPSATNTSEIVSHTADVAVDVTPRSHLLRSA